MTLSLKPILYLFWSFMSPAFLSEFEKQVTTYHNAEHSNSTILIYIHMVHFRELIIHSTFAHTGILCYTILIFFKGVSTQAGKQWH